MHSHNQGRKFLFPCNYLINGHQQNLEYSDVPDRNGGGSDTWISTAPKLIILTSGIGFEVGLEESDEVPRSGN